jgi:hypothetical protein
MASSVRSGVSTTLSSEAMTEDERKKRIHAILDKHDQATRDANRMAIALLNEL